MKGRTARRNVCLLLASTEYETDERGTYEHTHRDGKHTLFGEIVSGMETLKLLEALGSRSGRPSETILIEKASITMD